MTQVIEARGLKKSYRSTRALEDVSFTVEPGRIVGLIGPNGAGKTRSSRPSSADAFRRRARVFGLVPPVATR